MHRTYDDLRYEAALAHFRKPMKHETQEEFRKQLDAFTGKSNWKNIPETELLDFLTGKSSHLNQVAR